jgi:predicted short-subunit dehydrogenase-like oxidoreductase (DUF2520 family)
MKKSLRSVTVIGLGNWGTSLAHALAEADVPLQRASTLDRAPLAADILWLCVPDAAIAPVSQRLADRFKARRRKMTGQIVVHSSGALNVQVLQAAAKQGASVASVHPVMSFPTRTPVPVQGVPFGIEADPTTRRVLNALVCYQGREQGAVSRRGRVFFAAAGQPPGCCPTSRGTGRIYSAPGS